MGAMVVTRSSEMTRGFVNDTRSASTEDLPTSRISLTAGSNLRRQKPELLQLRLLTSIGNDIALVVDRVVPVGRQGRDSESAGQLRQARMRPAHQNGLSGVARSAENQRRQRSILPTQKRRLHQQMEVL